jgi:hypothetical protein
LRTGISLTLLPRIRRVIWHTMSTLLNGPCRVFLSELDRAQTQHEALSLRQAMSRVAGFGRCIR